MYKVMPNVFVYSQTVQDTSNSCFGEILALNLEVASLGEGFSWNATLNTILAFLV